MERGGDALLMENFNARVGIRQNDLEREKAGTLLQGGEK